MILGWAESRPSIACSGQSLGRTRQRIVRVVHSLVQARQSVGWLGQGRRLAGQILRRSSQNMDGAWWNIGSAGESLCWAVQRQGRAG